MFRINISFYDYVSERERERKQYEINRANYESLEQNCKMQTKVKVKSMDEKKERKV